MVNFGLRLRDNAYAEWKYEYIDYGKLKRALRKQQHLSQELDSASSKSIDSDARESTDSEKDTQRSVTTSPSLHSRVSQQPEFETLLEQEYHKIEDAYHGHLDEISGQLDLLQHQYREDAPGVTQHSLKNALIELHRLSNHLLNFSMLNYTGCIKILKKHDKKLAPIHPPLRPTHVNRLQQDFDFPSGDKCRDLLSQIEKMFARAFCDGNESVAKTLLLTKKEDAIDWSHVYVGIKVGACLVLLFWVVWDSIIVPSFKSEREKHLIDLTATKAYPVYRGLGGVLLLQWMLGLSLYVWRSARINYSYIFELDPRRAVTYGQMFSSATNMTIVYLVNVLMYYKVVNGYFPEELLHRGYYPLILYLYAIYFYLIRPWGKQIGVLRTLGEVACSPFFVVTFFHTFVGDYLTSTVKVTQDLSWSICFFATREFLEKDEIQPDTINAALKLPGLDPNKGYNCKTNVYYVNIVLPLLSALPLWWRFLQNIRRVYDTGRWWPHLANAIKYALTQVVALFGLFHPFYHLSSDDKLGLNAFQITWLALFSLSSLYSWVWDVTMDWGLGRPRFRFLNERQMFSRSEYYYTAIVVDLFLRFAWTLSLIPPQSLSFMPYRYLQPFTMAAELFRRTFWSFFRLENEHLRNTQGFRRIDFIPLHYDHGTGAEEGGKGDSDMEPMGGKMFMVKILLILFVVVGLSVLAILVEKH